MVVLLCGLAIAVLGAAGMYWLKRAATARSAGTDHFLRSLLATPDFWYGGLCYGAAFLVLMFGLRSAQVSQFFPVAVGLNVLLVSVVGWIWFAEPISSGRLVGIALLLGGVFLVARD